MKNLHCHRLVLFNSRSGGAMNKYPYLQIFRFDLKQIEPILNKRRNIILQKKTKQNKKQRKKEKRWLKFVYLENFFKFLLEDSRDRNDDSSFSQSYSSFGCVSFQGGNAKQVNKTVLLLFFCFLRTNWATTTTTIHSSVR